jgi:hypothetical protein
VSKQKWIFLVIVLLMMVGTVGVLARLKNNQKLGTAGVKTVPSVDGPGLEVYLPESVLDYTSKRVTPDSNVVRYLPADTTYGQRRYTAPDGSWVHAGVVLVGADRTSIHTPEFCIPGGGWHIGERTEVSVPIEGSPSYDLQVMRWTLNGARETEEGKRVELRGFYVFWFVADGEQTVVHRDITWRIILNLLRTGVLQRWAYVSYFAVCEPGREEETFERIKKLIAGSVPQFQSPPRSVEFAGPAQ